MPEYLSNARWHMKILAKIRALWCSHWSKTYHQIESDSPCRHKNFSNVLRVFLEDYELNQCKYKAYFYILIKKNVSKQVHYIKTDHKRNILQIHERINKLEKGFNCVFYW